MPDQLPLLPGDQPVPLADHGYAAYCDECGDLTLEPFEFDHGVVLCLPCAETDIDDAPDPCLDIRPIVTVDTKGKL